MLTIIAALTAVIASPGKVPFQVDVLAQKGDPIPGSDETFTVFTGPTISGDQAVFVGYGSLDTTPIQKVCVRANSSGLTMIAADGDPVPGFRNATITTVMTAGEPVFSIHGNSVVLVASIAIPGQTIGHKAVLLGDGETLLNVADTYHDTPGVDFITFSFNPVLVGNDVFFPALTADTSDTGVWRRSLDERFPEQLVGIGTLLPGSVGEVAPEGTFYPSYTNVGTTGEHVSFRVKDDTGYGDFTFDPQADSFKLLIDDQIATKQDLGAVQGVKTSPSAFAFTTMQDGVLSLYRSESPGEFELIADTNTPVPGFAGITFDDFVSFTATSRYTCFMGYAGGSGQGSGIYISIDGVLHPILLVDDPFLGDKVVFLSMRPGSAEADRIAVRYVLERSSGVAMLTLNLAPLLADLNHDGLIESADLGQLLASWGTCSNVLECPADLDGDGEVDGKDLGLLLSAWTTE